MRPVRPVEQMPRSLLLQHFLHTRQVPQPPQPLQMLQPPQPLRMLQPLQPLQMRHGFNLLNPCDHCNLWNPCDHCNHSYGSPTDWTQPMTAYWICNHFRIPFRFPSQTALWLGCPHVQFQPLIPELSAKNRIKAH